MTFAPPTQTPSMPLRLWPGVAAALLLLLVWFVYPLIDPEVGGGALLGAAAGGLLIVFWWLFFSRAPWRERLGILALMVIEIAALRLFLHPSVATAGMGFLYFIYAIPVLALALVAGAVVGRRRAPGARRRIMAAFLLAAGLGFLLVRTGGVTGDTDSDFAWRWSKTAEERLLAQAGRDAGVPIPAAVLDGTGAAWPGFRGPARDSAVPGVRITTDWTKSPPVELWRRPVGPGWSSFAVLGDLVYTQEQLGREEIVSCYRLSTGEPVWKHRDAVRFWESNAGAGPRATPTVSGDRLYTLGATGILNALAARDGSVIWSRNAATDTGTKVPEWGFAGSPLVVGDAVVVAASGALAAFDLATGSPRWFGPKKGGGYSSPQLATVAGVEQILLLNSDGVVSLAPGDGALLWQHAWSGDGIVQPAQTAEGDVLLGAGSGIGANVGVRRLAVANGAGGWTAAERWTSNGLKPYFSDFVVHEGHAYGFDGGILAAIDLTDGSRKWKGGRYGHGQLLLLPDQDLLLVLSEQGELALVEATPGAFTELARRPAITGKTWNHPVLVGDTLLVRNAEDMAAFRLARVGG